MGAFAKNIYLKLAPNVFGLGEGGLLFSPTFAKPVL